MLASNRWWSRWDTGDRHDYAAAAYVDRDGLHPAAGRGLRRAKDKSGLTVLDYIGQQRREFRFGAKLKALTGLRRKELEKAVEDGFPYLPSGSQIILDRRSRPH